MKAGLWLPVELVAGIREQEGLGGGYPGATRAGGGGADSDSEVGEAVANRARSPAESAVVTARGSPAESAVETIVATWG